MDIGCDRFAVYSSFCMRKRRYKEGAAGGAAAWKLGAFVCVRTEGWCTEARVDARLVVSVLPHSLSYQRP